VASQCKDIISAGDFRYCEYYKHCKSIPCSDPIANFQKTHDFNGEVENSTSLYYIVQYRHPIEQIISHYEYIILREKEEGIATIDTKKRWIDFLFEGELPKKDII